MRGREGARLQDLQRRLTVDYHRSRVGTRTEILLEGESRRGGGQLCGRDPYHRIVNLVPARAGESQPMHSCGTRVGVEIVEATPHSLLGSVCGNAGYSEGILSSGGARAVKLGSRPADEEGRGAGAGEAALGELFVIG